MKLLLKLLVSAALVQFSLAVYGITKNGFHKNGKYRLNREPPLDTSSVFDDEVVVETKWIEQRLNNFDPQDNRTWSMRYMENSHYLQDGGPIFIYVGGEWTISEGWLRTGHMHDMARDLNGTMFYTEHRYYGQSRPTENLSMENLVFLNIDQALADLAHFIVEIKQTVPELSNSGVILVGASYSATMATWFMQKYPHLANGAWSSSAPLEAKVDFVEYKEVVSDAIESVGGLDCSYRIRRAFEELERLAESGDVARIEELFRFCQPFDLTNQLDVWSFFSDVSGPFSGTVQYHRESSQDIQNECNILINTTLTNDLEALARWFWFEPENPEGPPAGVCYDHRYELFIYFYGGIEWHDIAAMYEIRQWLYQTCVEYGWYQTSGSENILFGSNFPVNLSLQWCADLYEGVSTESIYRNVDRTNVIYGAKNPTVRNVYSTHGQFDPWRPMGVQEDINESSPTVILPMESHCSDLYSRSINDTPEMAASKDRISELVQRWLGLWEEIPTAPEVPTTTGSTTGTVAPPDSS